MKRRLKAYKKTVSIVDESTIALYESLAEKRKAFLWKVMTRKTEDTPLWVLSRKH